jgi:type IV pilus assembly protein PilA
MTTLEVDNMQKIQMNKGQQGFTLIELMIVVAIIGILAAVAIPQYQNYVGKANFASGLSTLTALKTNIENYIMEEGAFPADAALVAATLGMESDANDLGDITLTPGADAAAGKMTFEFSKGNPGIKGKKISLSRDTDGVWSCASDADTDYIRGCESGTP